MKLMQSLAIKLTSSRAVQRMLDRAVTRAQLLLGVGLGADVGTSGEAALFGRLSAAPQTQEPLCIFDVGANRGQFLDLALAALGNRPFVIHSFEPSASTFKMLTTGRQPDSRVFLNPFGLGKSKAELTLYYDQPGSGLASLTKRRLDHFGMTFEASERVTIETLDSYCEERGIKHIDLLKMDVEGHELDVLLGAQQMFAGAVSMATFESGGCNIDTRTFFQDFFYFFRGCGMSVYRITPSGLLFAIPKYEERFEQFRTTNFVAVRDS
jgi:FkbM family methyltransferase